MALHLDEFVMKIDNADATLASGSASAAPPDAETLVSPELRPNVLATPEQRRTKQAVAAALFGHAAEGLQIGRYRLLHRIGSGGMGVVYAAHDDRLDRPIALKLLRANRLASAQATARTIREARALARLSHPNVVHVYEVGELEEQQIFVAMEFLAGPTLREWLDAERRPWPEILAVFRQAGAGLAAAHAQGIIHRDVKPHNAMFGADGRVRVLDFGLAQVDGVADASDPSAPPSRDLTGALTVTGAVLGTPAYMAPEQFAARRSDARTDQFSFCVALYEALYGARPFAGQTLAELTESVASGRVVPPPTASAVPRWVHTALLRGLRADPAARWPSMDALLAALAGDVALRRRTRTRWTGASVAFASVVAGGVWWTGESLRRVDAEQRAALDREVVEARAAAAKQSAATALAQAREQLDRAPIAALQTLARLDALAPADVPAVRTLALAALSRGLPDRVLTGPDAELAHVRPAARDGSIFAQDATGGVWRWDADRDRGERIATLDRPAASLLVAPGGQAWVAATDDTLIGAHAERGWQTWRAAGARRPALRDTRMITADERWLVAHRTLPVLAWDLRTGLPVDDAFPAQPAIDPQVRAVVSPDARFLAQARPGDDAVAIWDRSTGETRRAPAQGSLVDLFVVAGDHLLGTSERDGATRLIAWDLARATANEWRGDVTRADDLGPLVGLTVRGAEGPAVCAAQLLSPDCRWQRPLVDSFDRILAGTDGFAVETLSLQQARRPLELGELATGAVLRRFHPPAAYDDGRLDHAGRYIAARGAAIDVWERRDPAHTILDLRRGAKDTTHWSSLLGAFVVRHHAPTGALTRIDPRTGASEPLAPCLAAGEKVRIEVDESGRVLVSHATGAIDLYPAGDVRPRAIAGVSEPILRAFLSPDGRGFAALATAGTAYVWTDPDAAPRSFDVGTKGLRTLMYDRTGARLVSMSSTRGVQVFAGGAPTQLAAPPADPDELLLPDLSHDGRWLAVVRYRARTVTLHDFQTGATRDLPVTLELGAEGYYGLKIAPDGRQIAVTTAERLWLIDVATNDVRRLDAGANIWSLQFDRDGELLFAAVGDAVQVWDIATLTPTRMWTTKGFARMMLLSPEGDLVTREEGELHRFSPGLVPRDPDALHAWLRDRVARLP